MFIVALSVSVLALAFTGCAKKEEPTTTTPPATEQPAAETPAGEEVDSVATASIVDNGEDLVKALSADGFWLAGTLNDIVLTDDLVVEGEFIHRDAVARKIALYTQDENRNITASFSLTAPKMIVKSENLRLQGGTFIGDVYVEANGFQILDGGVEGNVYFATKEALDSFTMHSTGFITGTVQAESVDVVTTASLVVDANDLVKGLSADGTWIVATYNNMNIKEDIIVEGEFVYRDTVQRKLVLYTQDADRNITAQHTVTAPKMVVRSENFKIQGGKFVGDIYVEANQFQIGAQATVGGNIYFASQEYMDSFIVDETAVHEGEASVQ